MSKNEVIKRINDVIKDYKEASMASKYDDLSDLHNDALVNNLETRALSVIESYPGPNSVYRKKAYYEKGRCISINGLIGILYTIKSDLEEDRIKLGKEKEAQPNIGEAEHKDKNSEKVITEGHIKNLTLGQLIKSLSVGAWIWLFVIASGIFLAGFKLGLHFEKIKDFFNR